MVHVAVGVIAVVDVADVVGLVLALVEAVLVRDVTDESVTTLTTWSGTSLMSLSTTHTPTLEGERGRWIVDLQREDKNGCPGHSDADKMVVNLGFAGVSKARYREQGSKPREMGGRHT